MQLLKPAIVISLFVVAIAGTHNAHAVVVRYGQLFYMCPGDDYGLNASDGTKYVSHMSKASDESVATLNWKDEFRRAEIEAVGPGKAEVLLVYAPLREGGKLDESSASAREFTIIVLDCPSFDFKIEPEERPRPERPDQTRPPVEIQPSESSRPRIP